MTLAAQQGRNCGSFEELLKPITNARTAQSADDAHAYFFGVGSYAPPEQARRLQHLAEGLELTAAHLMTLNGKRA